MTRILAVETALQGYSVALQEGSAPIASFRSDDNQRAAEQLVLNIDTLMRQAGWAYESLALIGVNIGPGSFTGIRIGMAAAKGLAMAHRTPCIGVNTHELLLAQRRTAVASVDGRPWLIATDARRGQLYVQRFAADFTPMGDILLLTLREVQALMGSAPHSIGGNAQALLRPLLGDAHHYLPVATPQATALAQLLNVRYSSGGLPTASENMEPLYIRPPDAKLPGARTA